LLLTITPGAIAVALVRPSVVISPDKAGTVVTVLAGPLN